MCDISGLPPTEVFAQLREAGLGSTPGTAAEVGGQDTDRRDTRTRTQLDDYDGFGRDLEKGFESCALVVRPIGAPLTNVLEKFAAFSQGGYK